MRVTDERAVYKFILHLKNSQKIRIPRDSFFLSCQIQRDMICLWFLCDTKKELEEREFFVVGTGEQFDHEGLEYLETVQVPPFVWHVFERVE